MTEHTERFLQAEEQADRLVAQLQELKVKIEAHGEAATSLGEARDGIQSLVGDLAVSAEGMRDVIEKLSQIGTPAIIEGLATTRTELTSQLNAQYERIRRLLLVVMVLGAVSFLGLLGLILLYFIRG
jgi:hypothetical protein